MVCTGATSQAWLKFPHFQPFFSLGFKQMKQNSLPHRQVMCLQAFTCSISIPHEMHARREGHPATPTISFLEQLRKIFRRLSSPAQTAFPQFVVLDLSTHSCKQCQQNWKALCSFFSQKEQVNRTSFLLIRSTKDLQLGHS